MRPVGPKIEAEGRDQGWVLGEGQQAPSPPGEGQNAPSPPAIGGLWGALRAPPAYSSGRSPYRPKVFHYFQHSEWPLLSADYNIVNCGSPNIIVNFVMLYDVLVYEIKFTGGKSKEMVFTEGKRRDRWGNSTLW